MISQSLFGPRFPAQALGTQKLSTCVNARVSISTNRLRWHHFYPTARTSRCVLTNRAVPRNKQGSSTVQHKLRECHSVEAVKVVVDQWRISHPGGDLNPAAVAFGVDVFEALARVHNAAAGRPANDQVRLAYKCNYTHPCRNRLPLSSVFICCT